MVGRIVIREQDANTGHRGRRSRWLFVCRQRQVQHDRKRAALAKFACDADLPAHQFHQQLAYGQAQSRPAVLTGGGSVGLREFFKYFADLVRFKSDAGIGHRNAHLTLLWGPLRNIDLYRNMPPAGELDRIANQVGQNLPQPCWISHHPARVGRGIMHDQFQSLAPGVDTLPMGYGFDFVQQVK